MLPRRKFFAVPLALCVPLSLHAGDYTYQQTTQLTGGSLLHMMKTVGVFSSQARHIGDPIVSTIYLKDNRLANVTPDSIEIIDLDKETITNIDVQKKTYTVMTFDQMKQAIENAREQMQKQAAQQPQPQPTADRDAKNVQMSFDVKVRKTGATKEVSGLQSSEAILTMTMIATNTQTQQSGNMAITNDMWMVPEVPGYEQVREFYERLGAKMADAASGLGSDFRRMLAQQPGANMALGDMAKEMQKIEGVPIMQIMRMGTTTNGQPLPAASETALPQGPPPPTAGQVAKAGMTSMISSRLGGLGGFGKKKNNPPDQSTDQNSSTPTSAVFMETQVTTSNFSSAPVDPSHFEIPAGYKQVQPQLQPAPTNTTAQQ